MYLRAGRDYEAEKVVPDAALVAKAYRFDERFLTRFAPVLNAISREIIAERRSSSWLVDHDVIDVFNALTTTMKTLSSGIYYDSAPEGPIRQALFRRVKSLIDDLMKPQQEFMETALKPAETVDILEFLTISAQTKASNRPKSRRYLDWLESMLGPMTTEEPGSGLILP
jgi:hypothetical protein